MADQTAGDERGGLNLPGGEAIGEVRALTEDTAQKLMRLFESSHPVRTLRGSQVASGFVGAVGFALFVVGVEHAAGDIPIVDNAWGSIIVGLILLAAAGAVLRRLAH
jgi:hypothetical protein